MSEHVSLNERRKKNCFPVRFVHIDQLLGVIAGFLTVMKRNKTITKTKTKEAPGTAFSQKLFRRETSDVNLLSDTDTSFNELDLFSRVQAAPANLK